MDALRRYLDTQQTDWVGWEELADLYLQLQVRAVVLLVVLLVAAQCVGLRAGGESSTHACMLTLLRMHTHPHTLRIRCTRRRRTAWRRC